MRTPLIAAGLAAGALFTGAAHAQAADWSGVYFGGAVGYADPSGDDGETLLFDTNRDGGFNDTVRTGAGANAFSPGFCDGAAIGNAPAAGCVSNDGNLSLALRAGYDWQFGSWVVGGLAEAAMANIGDDVTGFSTTPASYTFYRDLNYTLAARVRAGYAFDRYLAYGTAGLATGDIDHAFTTTNAANSFTATDSDDANGYQLGGGFEAQMSENISLGVEYLYTSLDDDGYQIAVGRGTAPLTNPFLLVNSAGTDMRRSSDELEFSTISLTANWRY